MVSIGICRMLFLRLQNMAKPLTTQQAADLLTDLARDSLRNPLKTAQPR